MTTLSKEDVVRWEAEADKFKTGEFTDTLDLKSFATLARADLVAENERLKGELEKSDAYTERKDVERDKLRTALAAAEAREVAALNCLGELIGLLVRPFCDGSSAKRAAELLRQPRDDSALREMIAGVYKECATACKKYGESLNNEWNRGLGVASDLVEVAEECEEAIRALAEKAKG